VSKNGEREHAALGIALCVVGAQLDGYGDETERIPYRVRQDVKKAMDANTVSAQIDACDILRGTLDSFGMDIAALKHFLVAYTDLQAMKSAADYLPVLGDSAFQFKMQRAEKDVDMLTACYAWALACLEYVQRQDVADVTFEALAKSVAKLPESIDIYAIADGAMLWAENWRARG